MTSVDGMPWPEKTQPDDDDEKGVYKPITFIKITIFYIKFLYKLAKNGNGLIS
jgi:hypothetical protein